MTTDLLPPLHDVEPPLMSVSPSAVIARAEQIRRTSRRRRFGLGLTAAAAVAAVAAVAVGTTQLDRGHDSPRPAHSSKRYGGLFQQPVIDHDGSVPRGRGGSYVVTRQPNGALLIAAKDGGSMHSLGVRRTFDGGWLAQDGPNSVLAAVAPKDAEAVFVFANVKDAPPEGSQPPDTQPWPVVLADGSTAVVAQTLNVASDPPTVVGYRRTDGSYIGYGGGVSGIRHAGSEIVISPKTGRLWFGSTSEPNGGSYTYADLSSSGVTIDCSTGRGGQSGTPDGNARGCTALVVPLDLSVRPTPLTTDVQVTELPVPNTAWKVVFGERDAGPTGKPLIGLPAR